MKGDRVDAVVVDVSARRRMAFAAEASRHEGRVVTLDA